MRFCRDRTSFCPDDGWEYFKVTEQCYVTATAFYDIKEHHERYYNYS